MPRGAGSTLPQPVRRGCAHSSITWAAPLSQIFVFKSREERAEEGCFVYRSLTGTEWLWVTGTENHQVNISLASQVKTAAGATNEIYTLSTLYLHSIHTVSTLYLPSFYMLSGSNAKLCLTYQLAGLAKSLSHVVVTDRRFWKKREILLRVFALGKQHRASAFSNTYFTKHT